MTTDEVVEVIRRTKQRGMVPFVIVIPVSPELLSDASPKIIDILAREAGDAMRRSVGDYYAAHPA